MSKAKTPKSGAQKEIQSIFYRVERIDTFAWQPISLTVFTDGSIVEEHPFKADVLHITLRKIGDLMSNAAHENFENAKRERVRAEQRAPQ